MPWIVNCPVLSLHLGDLHLILKHTKQEQKVFNLQSNNKKLHLKQLWLPFTSNLYFEILSTLGRECL